jgi:hypothetical protein
MSFWMMALRPAAEPVPPPPDVDALFAEWYRAYPLKKAPRDARKAFGTVLSKHLATFDELMQGVAAYVQDINRNGTGPRFIKYPASWLRAGCWADEHAPPYSPDTIAAARIGAEFRAARRL